MKLQYEAPAILFNDIGLIEYCRTYQPYGIYGKEKEFDGKCALCRLNEMVEYLKPFLEQNKPEQYGEWE
jgi:hypothetical protein